VIANGPMGERPSHCEQCGERPINLQLYPLRPFGGAWICSRHPEYSKPAEYPTERPPRVGPMTIDDV
jgi:hypothetical protein